MKHVLLSALLSLIAAQSFALNTQRIYERKPNPYVGQDEKAWVEVPQALAAYPSKPEWLQLDMPVTVRPAIFVNLNDLQRGEDQVIRLTLRQLSKSGIDNISREGLHCSQRSYRSYAFADLVNQRWIESQNPQWRKLDGLDMLRRELIAAMCPDGWMPLSDNDLTANLQRASKKH
ncbi:CNP1-like family protein [Vogesella sp. GCM10023246]|uniref:CNP1-like family protein n=1 Tax=Vogesella oryzagri TaxID=3160864 RepID=A0ABV1M4I4_9NEIS